MLRNWKSQPKVVGVKQSRRAIREGRAVQVFLATNADPALTAPLAELCAAEGVPVEWTPEGYRVNLKESGWKNTMEEAEALRARFDKEEI